MFVFDQARPGEWTEALDLAYSSLPPATRRQAVLDGLSLLLAGRNDPAGLRVARHGDAIVGVQMCEPLGGACCLFWPPVARDADVVDRLVRDGVAWSRGRGHKIGQLLLTPDMAAAAGPFLRAGFRHVTTLDEMHHPLNDAPVVPIPPLRYESYTPGRRDRFAAALLRSYEGTLDCPELNGVRTVDEILAGHRAAGRDRADLWWLAHLDRAPAGVGLVTEMPDGRHWELSYLGVMPAYRRRGVGRALTVRAIEAARAEGAARLSVAVDRRNAPALRLYAALGFTAGEARHVYLSFFARDAAAD